MSRSIDRTVCISISVWISINTKLKYLIETVELEHYA